VRGERSRDQVGIGNWSQAYRDIEIPGTEVHHHIRKADIERHGRAAL
jgi:hypothetical protein